MIVKGLVSNFFFVSSGAAPLWWRKPRPKERGCAKRAREGGRDGTYCTLHKMGEIRDKTGGG